MMQVLIAFGSSAYLTLILLFVHYLVDHQQQQNSVDRVFLAAVVPKKLTIQTQESSEKWARAFDAAVLCLGDTQIITSVAILLSGYVQLPCGLSTYHWEIIVDLAWFSALTHLTALTSLRHYFRRRPAMALWRVVFMGITLVLLGSALYPAGYVPQSFTRDTDLYPTPIQTNAAFTGLLSCPAICLFNKHRRAELVNSLLASEEGSRQQNTGSLPFNTTLVTISLAYFATCYLTRVIRLFRSSSERANQWLRVAPVSLMWRMYEVGARSNFKVRILWRLWRGFWLTCIVLSEAVYNVGDSTLWEISWLAAALAFGTVRLMGHKRDSSLSGEDTWGFGQVLALILSALPLWSFYTTLQEAMHKPLSIEIATTGRHHITELERLEHSYWFRGLVGFLFGTALTFIGGTLYTFCYTFLFPGWASGGDVFYYDPGHVVVVYAIAFSCSGLACAMFASLALAFHFNVIGSSKLSSWWRHRTETWSTLTRRKARRWMWISLVLLLLLIQVTTYVLVFTVAYTEY